MNRLAIAAAAAALIAAAPQVQHGGRIKWAEPKGPADFEQLVRDSHIAGRAVMVYYTQDN
jgi:hypothetical protein